MIATLTGVAFGGALGALARYGIDSVTVRKLGAVPEAFPWGTLLINVAGSFLLGVLFVALVEPGSGPDWLRAFLTTGLLGAFTTFSTFSVQTVQLAETGRGGLAIAYVLASVLAGVLAATMAILITRVSPAFGWFGASVVATAITASFVRAA
jgi:fluoride exporter